MAAEEVVIQSAQAELFGAAAVLAAAAPAVLEAAVSVALEAAEVLGPAVPARAEVGKQLLSRHGIFRKILEHITFTNFRKTEMCH